ncbi:maleylpyruvate isomerase family mycothiol-dependent enzyme [Dactylosporangium sp. AC04546]|uniref:maleylpyruvate isomerase family mycothiol-dependent enzyme n=1 Tax=Dactylosporangium sp. AC04546 TaxID=2862460 RepID=UPI001EDE9AAF|nr:maleylpyruvate isomerase family mycothiol-dependent enzyme [Dactylosporangium sp. AC04546]WVK79664.1 maleylpyruvate isomerase family mycothiol-dependent enzyme [Dactylosporangium sp. AC04546]
MHIQRYLECLETDFARLREVAPPALAADVPSCPGWTVADLTRHVGEVYLHKTLAMREGAEPDPWPPAELAGEDPLALLDRAHADLLAEFAARRPQDPAGSWYTPDQTVGFWYRRMAQETVIHRVDAELGAGVPLAPIPPDLAADGVDELLKIFVAFGVAEWGSYFTEALRDSPGRTVAIRAAEASWLVNTVPFTVTDGAAAADATVTGDPAAVLLWLWNRAAGGVTVEGDPEAVAELRRCIVVATQ